MTTPPPIVIFFFDMAKSHVISKGHEHEIEWCQDIKFEDQTALDFLHEYTWVVLSAAFKNQLARVIYDDFWDAIWHDKPHPFDIIRHPNKRKAIVNMMADYNKHFEILKSSKDPVAYLRTLPYMGDALSCHLARNLGFDVVKPDVWLKRLAEKWEFETPDAMCRYIQKFRPELRIGTIDVILWRYCNLTGKVE